MHRYCEYKEIDVPEFIKNKNKKEVANYNKKDIDKAYIKGGISGVLMTIGMLLIMLLIAVIENY